MLERRASRVDAPIDAAPFRARLELRVTVNRYARACRFQTRQRPGSARCGTVPNLRWRSYWFAGSGRPEDAIAQRVRGKEVRIDCKRPIDRLERLGAITRIDERAGRAEI